MPPKGGFVYMSLPVSRYLKTTSICVHNFYFPAGILDADDQLKKINVIHTHV